MKRGVVFLDAEGTLWRPRPGRTADDFWKDPSVARAGTVFEPEPSAHDLLKQLREDGRRIVVLSRHVPALLEALLVHFRFRDLVDDVRVEAGIVPGAKAQWAREYLRRHRIPSWQSVMVGDSGEHDVRPFLAEGLRALLLDRDYNRRWALPRIQTLGELARYVDAPPCVTSGAP